MKLSELVDLSAAEIRRRVLGMLRFRADNARLQAEVERLREKLCKTEEERKLSWHRGYTHADADKAELRTQLARAEALQVRCAEVVREECAAALPTNWCDEALTGTRAIAFPPEATGNVEALCRRLASRLRAIDLPALVARVREESK